MLSLLRGLKCVLLVLVKAPRWGKQPADGKFGELLGCLGMAARGDEVTIDRRVWSDRLDPGLPGNGLVLDQQCMPLAFNVLVAYREWRLVVPDVVIAERLECANCVVHAGTSCRS